MLFLRVKKWDDFQHYKDRNPPWIKLYNGLLEDYHFTSLSDQTRYHLIAIWLLASRTQNKIPYNSEWVKNKIMATTEVDLDSIVKTGFLEIIDEQNQPCSTMLASCKQSAIPETERESESETKKKRSSDGRGQFKKPSLEEVSDYCQERSNRIDPQKFCDYYEAKGWKIGSTKMKDWKAAVRTWEGRSANNSPTPNQPSKPANTKTKEDVIGLISAIRFDEPENHEKGKQMYHEHKSEDWAQLFADIQRMRGYA